MAEVLPKLSVVLGVGACRQRAQRVVDAICAQTVLDQIEIVVLDSGGKGVAPLRTPQDARVVYVALPEATLFPKARAEGVLHASAPVVAFLEDHCFPSREWAAALIEAHRGECTVIGYAFTNANPQTYISRAALMKDYGPWLHPATAQLRTLMPGNNVSYRRDVLLSFGKDLEYMLTPDYSIQQVLTRRGHLMRLEPAALVAHQNYEQISPAAKSNATYARFLAGRRAKNLGWGPARRLAYALLTPWCAPVIGVFRVFRGLRGRESLLRDAIMSMPVFIVIACVAAGGEAMGYMFGEGDAETRMNYWEHDFERSAE